MINTGLLSDIAARRQVREPVPCRDLRADGDQRVCDADAVGSHRRCGASSDAGHSAQE
jgi:hypothetical protein